MVEVFVAKPRLSDAGNGLYGQAQAFVGWAVAGADRVFSAAVTGVTMSDQVTATATDTLGNTSEFSRNLAVGIGTPAPPTPLPTGPSPELVVSDIFSRTNTDTWGAASIGGAYAYLFCTAQDFDVNGSNGSIPGCPIPALRRRARSRAE